MYQNISAENLKSQAGNQKQLLHVMCQIFVNITVFTSIHFKLIIDEGLK